MKCTERQNDQVHHQKHCNPKKHSTDKPMLDDERKLPADQVIDSRRRDADKIMQAKPKNIYTWPSLTGTSSQQACGNSTRHAPSEGDVGQDHVEKSCNKPTQQNCGQGARNNHRRRCSIHEPYYQCKAGGESLRFESY